MQIVLQSAQFSPTPTERGQSAVDPTLNPSPQARRDFEKSGSPSIACGGRGWGLGVNGFTGTLLLEAPPPLKLISAPRIAGLLPANIPLKVEVIFEDKPLTWDEKVAIFRQMPRLRTIEEMDAEIAPKVQRLLDHLNHWREIRMARGQGQQP
ncbi:MAG: hypothetical protein ABI947_17145 [Chloroflexota bacterium]